MRDRTHGPIRGPFEERSSSGTVFHLPEETGGEGSDSSRAGGMRVGKVYRLVAVALALSVALVPGMFMNDDGPWNQAENDLTMPSAEGAVPTGPASDASKAVTTDMRSWTVAVYWDADNNLESITDAMVGLWLDSLTDRTDVAMSIYIDRLYGPANVSTVTEDGWTEALALGEVNSSDPDTLSSFIEFTVTEPTLAAENYILILQDHGLGYLGTLCDESEPVKAWMSIDGIRSAMLDAADSTGEKVDIVALDACCMSTVEVAYELRDTASYLVSSELTVPFDGLNYLALLSGLSEDPGISPTDLACKMVDDYGDWYSAPLGTYPTLYPYMQDFGTLSAVDLTKMSALGDAIAAFTEAILPKDGSLVTPLNIATNHNFVFKWENNMCVGFNADLMGMFAELATTVRDTHPEVAALCDDIVDAAQDAIVKNWASWRFHGTPTGISIFTPPGVGIYDVYWDGLCRVYDQLGLDFVDDTRWDEVLKSYYLANKCAGV